jgi:hypothetical protein
MAPEQAEMSGPRHRHARRRLLARRAALRAADRHQAVRLRTALQVGFQELLRTIREDEPREALDARVDALGAAAAWSAGSPNTLNARRWSARLRGDLDWIVMKAIAKDRTRRYDTRRTGSPMDLERFLRDEPVLADRARRPRPLGIRCTAATARARAAQRGARARP